MEFLDYFLILALGQGFILAFFLLTSKYYQSAANTWLAIGMIMISFLSISDIICEYYPPNNPIIDFLLNDLSLDFLIYLPFYYYVQISTLNSSQKIIYKVHWLIPFVIDSIINAYIVSNYSIEEISNSNRIQNFYGLETIASLLFNLFLCYKSYRLINTKTDVEYLATRKWLFKIWLSTFILMLVWIVMSLIYMIYTDMPIFISSLYLVVSLWLFWFIYTGVVNLNLIDSRKDIKLKLQRTENVRLENNSSPIFEEIDTLSKTEAKLEKDTKDKSNLEKLYSHFEKINSIIQNEHLYRNEDLSITDISQRMSMSTGYISQIIKKTTSKNFPTWINEFRVNEVKDMLLNQEFSNYTTLAIGLEAGFKSKSAFYATFKKVTGETPANFRKIKS